MITKEIFELEQKWAELLKGPKRSQESQTSNDSITSAELQTQLQQDEEYQKWLREKDEIGQMLDLAYAKDEKPLIDALLETGLDITSSWDLVNTKSSYKAAIPILVEHLSKSYHVKNKEGIVRSLAVKEAKGIACRAIIDEYQKAPKDNPSYRWAFGNTMAVIMTADYIDEVIKIVQDESNGESRHMFVAALGNTKSPRAKEPLQKLLEDKDKTISKEAQKALKKIK